MAARPADITMAGGDGRRRAASPGPPAAGDMTSALRKIPRSRGLDGAAPGDCSGVAVLDLAAEVSGVLSLLLALPGALVSGCKWLREHRSRGYCPPSCPAASAIWRLITISASENQNSSKQRNCRKKGRVLVARQDPWRRERASRRRVDHVVNRSIPEQSRWVRRASPPAAIGGELDATTGADGGADPGARPQ
jgi:hypothetical protein